MALGTLTTIALGLTAVAGVASVKESRDARRQTQKNLEQQKLEASEASALQTTRDSTEADILLGSDASETSTNRRKRRAGGTQRSSVLSKAGGLSTAQRVGI